MGTRKGSTKATTEGPSALVDATAQKEGAQDFPIVGVGASAGGLEAYEQFFRNLKSESGMAFILVPHLDPDHASILTEILQRNTVMPVVEAQDHVAVSPNHVYVIPPNREMAIFHRALQLSVPTQTRGHRMPIDSFLRSLALDQGDRAIGVILSGTGTDGTLGLRAILGAGGVSFVQDPATAKFDGMPTSAIQAGYASYVLPVEKIPEALLAGRRTRSVIGDVSPAAVSGLNRILLHLRTSTGHDFSQYKKSTVRRRVERRMFHHDIEDTAIYARYLQEHPAEVKLLFRELLINVTSFFRDPEAFETLKQDILPQLCAGKQEGHVFRVWVAGCATGEEAYSLAILLSEFMRETQQDCRVQIYATDLDEDAIAVARANTYPPNIAQDVTPERLHGFFNKVEAGFQVKKQIRDMIVFATQNVIKDPPFTQLDLTSCRNLMIYMEPELQDRLIRTFHFALKPGGCLFLSPSEGIVDNAGMFTALSRKWKLYKAVHTFDSTRPVMAGDLPFHPERGAKTPNVPVESVKETNIAELTKQLLVESYAPASVMIDLKGTVLYVYGETGRYLRPPPGHATLNVIEMARDELQMELRAVIHRAVNQGAPVLSRRLSIKVNGSTETFKISVRPLLDSGGSLGMLLLSFQDVVRASPRKSVGGKHPPDSADHIRIKELERELAYTMDDLHATIEEQQVANEELKSTNEELQSTNEELQSTNEELETSKEELQSINEELVTVNAELRAKIEQLAEMKNDMKNLLDNINIGTVFLDENMTIRRFTRDAALVYRLVATDIGRSLGDIKSDLEGVDLLAEARTVLDSLVPHEREVRGTDGQWYLARIQPYRTLENVIEGVVLTFVSLTEIKRAQESVRQARELAEAIVDTVREPLIVLSRDLRVISASRSFYRRFHVTPEETKDRLLYELGDGQWDIRALRDRLETVLSRDRNFDDFEVEHDFPVIGRLKMLLSGRRIIGEAGDTQLILLAMETRAHGGGAGV